jgi:hypothetical protein
MHYATSQKVAVSIPDEVDFSIDLLLPAAVWTWDQFRVSTSERKKHTQTN